VQKRSSSNLANSVAIIITSKRRSATLAIAFLSLSAEVLLIAISDSLIIVVKTRLTLWIVSEFEPTWKTSVEGCPLPHDFAVRHLAGDSGFEHVFPYYDTCPPGPGPVLCFHTDYSLNILAQIFGLIFALTGTNGLIRWLRTSHDQTG